MSLTMRILFSLLTGLIFSTQICHAEEPKKAAQQPDPVKFFPTATIKWSWYDERSDAMYVIVHLSGNDSLYRINTASTKPTPKELAKTPGIMEPVDAADANTVYLIEERDGKRALYRYSWDSQKLIATAKDIFPRRDMVGTLD